MYSMLPSSSTPEIMPKIFCCDWLEKPTAAIECFSRSNLGFGGQFDNKFRSGECALVFLVHGLAGEEAILVQVSVVLGLQQKMLLALCLAGTFQKVVEDVIVSGRNTFQSLFVKNFI